MIVVIHHAQTGQILRHIVCQPDEAALQPVPDGHVALVLPPGQLPIDDRRHRVEAGRIVEGPRTGGKSEAMAASRASKPIPAAPSKGSAA